MIEFKKPDNNGSNGTLRLLCRNYGFAQRGNTFFRVWGDGVLQVVQCRRERALHAEIINIGLFSMYGELMKQWFTASGAITRYSVVNCYNQNAMPIVFAPAIGVQLDMMKDRVLPWLNSIDTQKKLITAITCLDRRWNDGLKFAPYLACGEINHAKKVIKDILSQHSNAAVYKVEYESDENKSRREQEDRHLMSLIGMIEEGENAIKAYLRTNYERNAEYAKFCVGK